LVNHTGRIGDDWPVPGDRFYCVYNLQDISKEKQTFQSVHGFNRWFVGMCLRQSGI